MPVVLEWLAKRSESMADRSQRQQRLGAGPRPQLKGGLTCEASAFGVEEEFCFLGE